MKRLKLLTLRLERSGRKPRTENPEQNRRLDHATQRIPPGALRSRYPQGVADLERQLLELDQCILTQREQVAFCLNCIDRRIAFNQELKNDSQRKAERNHLMETDEDYIRANLDLRKHEAIRAEISVDLNLLTRTFSLLKLERREAIARLELNTSLAIP